MEKGNYYQERKRFLRFILCIFAFALAMLISTLCNKCNAQESKRDSVSCMIIDQNQAIGFMAKNMRAAYHEFRKGWICTASGSLLLYASLSIGDSYGGKDPRDRRSNIFKPLTFAAGSLLSLAGIYYLIDSHAAIGNAGRIYLTPQGVIVLRLEK